MTPEPTEDEEARKVISLTDTQFRFYVAELYERVKELEETIAFLQAQIDTPDWKERR